MAPGQVVGILERYSVLLTPYSLLRTPYSVLHFSLILARKAVKCYQDGYNGGMEMITSRRNMKVRAARALRRRKTRVQKGLFLVEGIRHVAAAVEAGYPLEAIFYAPDLLESAFALEMVKKAQGEGVVCYAVSAEVFDALAEKAGPQGILAVARQQWARLEGLTPKNFAWGAALIAPQDPGNIGTVLRTLDAVGADGLLLLEGGADPWHPTAVRAGMGAHFWLRMARASWETFAAWARARGYHLYGSSARGEADFRAVDYRRPCVLLLGSEREGLAEEQMEVCERVVRLPMRGRGSSLNLGVAAGVLLYAMTD